MLSDPDEPEPRPAAAVAVVRAWIEGDPPSDLRIHIVAATVTGGGEPTDLGTTASITEACDVVGTWLEGFAASRRGRRLGIVRDTAPRTTWRP